jgi:hypothetical protein
MCFCLSRRLDKADPGLTQHPLMPTIQCEIERISDDSRSYWSSVCISCISLEHFSGVLHVKVVLLSLLHVDAKLGVVVNVCTIVSFGYVAVLVVYAARSIYWGVITGLPGVLSLRRSHNNNRLSILL